MTTIEAVCGDITTVAVDAVVNPAHHALRGSDGGVDHAIHAAGGPTILFDAIERYPDGLASGDAGWTTAGDLAARWVIHTVVPHAQEAHGGRRLLEACYRSALQLADDLGAGSVAVPLLGAGSLGWAVRDSLAAALDAVAGSDLSVERVLLTTTEDTHRAAESALFQATPLRILQAVRLLHRRGYHRLRTRPGMSASGMYWRVTIASTDYDDGEDGYRDADQVIFYSTGGLREFAGGHVDAATSARQTAELILAAIPHLEPTADDPAYAQWYEGLMRLAERDHALPMSYADYFDHEKGWEIGWCSGLRYPAPPAPPSAKERA
ncbi:hypothetical protein GCM10011512_09640 [Tersicoccus solisilvae]|uniref:Macro domain-containing protein n=1 Tax=Tersicoccus solisilvae TaxID=1882339 RepID=A0ABQ1NX58_9MICC|nr:macro domain-containing protein [Tersicoccus solisilvae]GGC84861.1 hypothetical protein GCM10011512_09640 [Tersicoccus solisilvae]